MFGGVVSPSDQELGQMTLCQHTAESLVKWFWRGGHQRTGRYRLPGAWIADIYRVRESARALVAESARRKKTCAVWGPSQSGKSTLLSYFIDSPDSDDSALSWPGARNFRF